MEGVYEYPADVAIAMGEERRRLKERVSGLELELAAVNRELVDNWKIEKRQRDELKQQLEACQAEAAVMRQALEETGQELAELEQELELNASMLARQCDLAREAETERNELIRECDQVTTEVGAMTSVVNVADDMVRAYKKSERQILAIWLERLGNALDKLEEAKP